MGTAEKKKAVIGGIVNAQGLERRRWIEVLGDLLFEAGKHAETFKGHAGWTSFDFGSGSNLRSEEEKWTSRWGSIRS